MRSDARSRKLRAGCVASQAAQATVEMTLALVIGFLFVVASFKVWVWLTQAIVEESQCYQKTRYQAGFARGGFWNNPGLGRKPVAQFDDPGLPSRAAGGPPPHGNPYWNQPPALRIFRDGSELGNRCR